MCPSFIDKVKGKGVIRTFMTMDLLGRYQNVNGALRSILEFHVDMGERMSIKAYPN
jgi:hypothetical protein